MKQGYYGADRHCYVLIDRPIVSELHVHGCEVATASSKCKPINSVIVIHRFQKIDQSCLSLDRTS